MAASVFRPFRAQTCQRHAGAAYFLELGGARTPRRTPAGQPAGGGINGR